MRIILFLLLLSNSIIGQVVQEISLCPTLRTKYTYYIFNQNSNLVWTTPYGIYYTSNITIDWDTPGTYNITVQYTDESTCANEKRAITVIISECKESAIYFPNTFTPNNDKDNQNFEVKGWNIIDFHMLIYNRWGELIYETYSLDNHWNGEYKNQLCQQDVYVYTAFWQDINQKWGTKTGTVTLLY
jgi:gliding motility-associated-like protein